MTLVERLILENEILENDGMSQFQVYRNPDGQTYALTGTYQANSGNTYGIWTPIPHYYPDRRPPVYVSSPNPLWAHKCEKTVNSLGLSHAMHTLSNGPNGEVQICHWRDERWHSGISLNKVMIKAMIWFEGYEQHFATGDPIDNFVRTMT
jgi:hypothetical protein